MHLLDETARPEWIDYNGHLYDGYYAVIFARATDEFLLHVGLTPEVRAKTRHTIYTLETHVRFLREVKQGSALAIACQVLEIDHKRARIFLTMQDVARDVLAATSEQMLISIDQSGPEPKSAPWLQESTKVLEALAKLHSLLPTPDGAGRSIAIRR
jgi:acyl-CoA thioester hydrolase